MLKLNPVKIGKRSRRGLGRLALQGRDMSTGDLKRTGNLGHQMALGEMLEGREG